MSVVDPKDLLRVIRFGMWKFIAENREFMDDSGILDASWLSSRETPTVQHAKTFCTVAQITINDLLRHARTALEEGCVDPTLATSLAHGTPIATKILTTQDPLALDGTAPGFARDSTKYSLSPTWSSKTASCWLDCLIVAAFQLDVGLTRADMVTERNRTHTNRSLLKYITLNPNVFKKGSQPALNRGRDRFYDWCFDPKDKPAFLREKGRHQPLEEAIEVVFNGVDQMTFSTLSSHVCVENQVRSTPGTAVEQRIQLNGWEIDLGERSLVHTIADAAHGRVSLRHIEPCQAGCSAPRSVYNHLLVSRPPPTLCVNFGAEEHSADNAAAIDRDLGGGPIEVEWMQLHGTVAAPTLCRYELVGMIIMSNRAHYTIRWKRDGTIRHFDGMTRGHANPRRWHEGLSKSDWVCCIFLRLVAQESAQLTIV